MKKTALAKRTADEKIQSKKLAKLIDLVKKKESQRLQDVQYTPSMMLNVEFNPESGEGSTFALVDGSTEYKVRFLPSS